MSAGQTVSYVPSFREAGRTDNIKAVGSPSKVFGGGVDPGMARIEVKTRPKGAQIIINGYLNAKTTPATIDIRPGDYSISLQKEGYQFGGQDPGGEKRDKLRIDEQLLRY